MSDYVEIKVKDLKEGQRFWYSSHDISESWPERIMRKGTMEWADGTTNVPIDQMSPDETVYAKSIINTGDTMTDKKFRENQIKALESAKQAAVDDFDRSIALIRTALTAQIADAEVTYSIGDRIQFKGLTSEYIVARSDEDVVLLINLCDGGRWSGHIKVKDDTSITESEFLSITTHNGFTRTHDDRRQKVSE